MKKKNETRKSMNEYAAYLIRYIRREQCGTSDFLKKTDDRMREERDDVKQELALELFLRMEGYDPLLSKKSTFMSMALQSGVADLFGRRRAKKRDYRTPVYSLNDRAPGNEEGEFEYIDLVEAEHLPGNHRSSAEEQNLVELRMDMNRLLESLPRDQRLLCEKLKTLRMRDVSRGEPETDGANTWSAAPVNPISTEGNRRLFAQKPRRRSRKVGIPRATLYDKLKKIRAVFARAGMEGYL